MNTACFRAEVAGGGLGDELNASCCSTVDRRKEEGGAAQRRWHVFVMILYDSQIVRSYC